MTTRLAQFTCLLTPANPVKSFLFTQSTHYLVLKKIMLTAHLANHEWMDIASNYCLEITSRSDFSGTIPHTVLLAALLEREEILPVFEMNLAYPLDHYEQAQQQQVPISVSTPLQMELQRYGTIAFENLQIEIVCVPYPQVTEL